MINVQRDACAVPCKWNIEPVSACRGGGGGYDEEFDIAQLTSRRNEDFYRKIHWIAGSKYFQTLLDRKPPNDDPQVINLIR